MRELVAIVLEPPFRTKFRAWWRLAVDEAEGGIIVSVETAAERIVIGEIEGGVGRIIAAVVETIRIVVVGSGPISNTSTFIGTGERGEGTLTG